MARYTVRILYRNEDDPAKLVGVVEEEGIDGRKGFTGIRGLWRILASAESGKDRRVQGFPREAGRIRPETVVDLFSVLREE